ncbi:2'-deoxycytidine 5'-triphosphate deaminase, partial [uncultured Maricaulis sp.]|uniref:2'-deoxycytidine 5'-triphosphate deaminase domain-containing protein n=1 Tax=uncultured Maricaulis sp. TaxID=174710 RepID=UPI0030D6D8AB
MADTGILPDHHLSALTERGIVTVETPLADGQVQPASIDLRLGNKAWRLRASFLPGPDRTVAERLADDLVMPKVDLSAGAVLDTGRAYLAPLQEGLKLPAGLPAARNPKRPTARIGELPRVFHQRGVALAP